MSLSPSGIFIKLNGQHKTKVGRLCRFSSMEKKCESSFPLINILWLPQKSLGYLDDMIDPIDWCTGSMTLALMSFCSSLTA